MTDLCRITRARPPCLNCGYLWRFSSAEFPVKLVEPLLQVCFTFHLHNPASSTPTQMFLWTLSDNPPTDELEYLRVYFLGMGTWSSNVILNHLWDGWTWGQWRYEDQLVSIQAPGNKGFNEEEECVCVCVCVLRLEEDACLTIPYWLNMENEGKVRVKFLPLGIDRKVIKLREKKRNQCNGDEEAST